MYFKNVFVIRHADAENLREKRAVIGQTDHPLSELGRSQSRAIAETLATRVSSSFTRLLTSDVRRASQTAEAIGSTLGIRCEEYQQLREIYRGVAEGISESEAAAIEKSLPHIFVKQELCRYKLCQPQQKDLEVLEPHVRALYNKNQGSRLPAHL